MTGYRSVAVVAVVGFALMGAGQTVYFEKTDGIWEAPANWSGGAVPGVTNTVMVTFLGRTVRITQPGAVCGNLVAGYASGETGTVCLTTGTLASATSQNIGRNGQGTLSQWSGTTNTFSSFLTVGEGVTANGRYELLGGYLAGNGLSAEMSVGYNGAGVFYQSGGTLGELYADKYLYVGRTATGKGTFVMDGGEILFTNKTYVSVGHNGSGSFIASNGVVKVAKIFNVGKEAGGRGTFRLCGGSVSSGQFTMGEKASAAGAAFIESGAFTTTVEGWDVGYNGTGTVWQSGGVVTLNKYLYVGRAAGSAGSYVMTGGDLALTNAENHGYVGEYGKGSFLQSNGAFRVKNWLTVSRRTGSSGVLRIAGGSLAVEANLQLGEEPASNARFEIAGTNAAISCKTFVATTNAAVRFEIASGGVSKIAVQNQATLAGKLEVSVPYKLFNTPLTVIDAGSLSGRFDSVTPVFPLRSVDVTYEAATGNVTLSNFRYYVGTLMVVH